MGVEQVRDLQATDATAIGLKSARYKKNVFLDSLLVNNIFFFILLSVLVVPFPAPFPSKLLKAYVCTSVNIMGERVVDGKSEESEKKSENRF